ncbi:MAG TPA: HDIG domain-containing protein [Syntrophorhabdaceae bacterium]
MSLSQDDIVSLLHQYVKNERMVNHCYAAAAVMRALARRLGRDEEKWAMAGLLHDLDIELVGGDLSVHGLQAGRILNELGVDPEVVGAIVAHNEMAKGAKRDTEFQHALAAGETITGLVVATAMVYPDKLLASVKAKSITKRMKEKAFAASVSRENIRECEMIGIPLDEFVDLSLTAMKEISDKLGL